jgi:ribosome biogenesis SPOUT family RNA methylase Rps3
MVDATPQKPTVYIVEHFEEEFSDWTCSEYVNMILTLSNLYDTCVKPNNKLILTNFRFLDDLS